MILLRSVITLLSASTSVANPEGMTMAVGVGFECEPEHPYEVIGVKQPDGRLQLTVRAYLGLSRKHRAKCPAVAERWQPIYAARSITIDRIGDFALTESKQKNRQYFWSEQRLCTSDEALQRMLEVWTLIERFAQEPHLIEAVS